MERCINIRIFYGSHQLNISMPIVTVQCIFQIWECSAWERSVIVKENQSALGKTLLNNHCFWLQSVNRFLYKPCRIKSSTDISLFSSGFLVFFSVPFFFFLIFVAHIPHTKIWKVFSNCSWKNERRMIYESQFLTWMH